MIIVALFMVIMLNMLTVLNMLTMLNMQFFMVIMVSTSDQADSWLGHSETLPLMRPLPFLTSHICTFSWKYLSISDIFVYFVLPIFLHINIHLFGHNMPFCTRPHICTFLKEIDMKQSGTGLGEGKDTVFKPPSNQKFPYQLKSLFCFLLLSGAPVLR